MSHLDLEQERPLLMNETAQTSDCEEIKARDAKTLTSSASVDQLQSLRCTCAGMSDDDESRNTNDKNCQRCSFRRRYLNEQVDNEQQQPCDPIIYSPQISRVGLINAAGAETTGESLRFLEGHKGATICAPGRGRNYNFNDRYSPTGTGSGSGNNNRDKERDVQSEICYKVRSGRCSATDTDHYKVPTRTATTATTPTPLNEEFNQVIERERERTMEILRAKEAPRASLVELVTSPTAITSHCIDKDIADETDPISRHRQRDQQHHHSHPDSNGTVSPAPLSDYENVSLGDRDDNIIEASPIDPDHLRRKVNGIQQHRGDSASNSITDPSAYLNTLSLVSDPLDGLTQEDYSIVNQLDCGGSSNHSQHQHDA